MSVKDDLRARTEAALDLGVRGVPTLAIGDRLLDGDDALDEASGLRRRLKGRGPPGRHERKMPSMSPTRARRARSPR